MNISPFFVSPEFIHQRLSSQFKNLKPFDLYDVIEWCAEVETTYIGDIDLMFKIFQFPLTVNNSLALLPCNTFRVLDCYVEGGRNITFKPNTSGAYITNLKYWGTNESITETTIYINYIGLPLEDNTGYPLIRKGHEPACETFCKLKHFEEDVLLGKFDPNMWMRYDMQFSGQCIAAKQNPDRHKTRLDYVEEEIIKFNMIPRVGRMDLEHERFLDNGLLMTPYTGHESIK